MQHAASGAVLRCRSTGRDRPDLLHGDPSRTLLPDARVSQFLSPKFLRFRDAVRRPIDTDRPCVGCSYNLRGLTPFGRCPECGCPIEPGGAEVGPLFSVPVDARRRLRVGMLCFGLALLLPSAAAALWIAIGLSALGAMLQPGLHLLFIASAVLFGVGGWLITPAWTASALGPIALLRHAGRWGSVLVPLGAAAGVALDLGTRPTATWMTPGHEQVFLIMVALGRLGMATAALALLLVTARLAGESELDDEAGSITALWWLGAAVALIPAPFIPSSPLMHSLVSLVVIGLVYGPIRMSICVLRIASGLAWSLRMAAQAGSREARVAATREELDGHWRDRIRPLPTGDPPALSAEPDDPRPHPRG